MLNIFITYKIGILIPSPFHPLFSRLSFVRMLFLKKQPQENFYSWWNLKYPYFLKLKRCIRQHHSSIDWRQRWLDDRRWVIGDRRVTSKEHRGWASFGNVMVATTDVHNGAR